MKTVTIIPTFAYSFMERDEAANLYKREVSFFSEELNDKDVKDKYKEAFLKAKEENAVLPCEKDGLILLFVFAFMPDGSIKMNPQYISNLNSFIQKMKQKGIKGYPFGKRKNLVMKVFEFIKSYEDVNKSEPVKKVKEALALTENKVVCETVEPDEKSVEIKKEKEDKVKEARDKIIEGIDEIKLSVATAFLAGIFTVGKRNIRLSDFDASVHYTYMTAKQNRNMPIITFKEMQSIMFYLSLTGLKDYIELDGYEYKETKDGKKVRISIYKSK
jgi:nitrogen regulatory protein PII-like uncharacterized protein